MYLPEGIHLLTGYQQTPDTLFLSYFEDDFLKILNHPVALKFRFRFLEKKQPSSILIHFYYIHEAGALQLTFHVKYETNEFLQSVTKFFPSSTMYIRNIQ